MAHSVYTEVAKRMEKSLTGNHFAFKIEDKFLFRTLYSAFCRHNPNFHMPSIDTIVNQDHFDDAIDEMYRWYIRTYKKSFGLTFGHKGQQRTVTDSNVYNDGKYGFAAVYKEYTFKGNLTNPPKQVKDFRDFILHTAVAFSITPAELDELLKYYAFHRLHAKNIHDLSIYAALSLLPYGVSNPDVNPFYEVSQLYEEARAIVKDVRKDPNSERTAAALPTAFIRDSLMGDEVLTRERFIQFVTTNKDAFNMRHSILLQEYRKLSELFRYIYDNRDFEDTSDYWDDSTKPYSWYAFMATFCVDYSNPVKRFPEQFDYIDNDNKHPTRETMIVLWIYAYTFVFAHGVTISKKAFDQICKRLDERQIQADDNSHSWLADAQRCFYRYNGKYIFNVQKFIFQTAEDPKTIFRGNDLIEWLNRKLCSFDFGPLNANAKFDAVILQFSGLKIILNEQQRDVDLLQTANRFSYNSHEFPGNSINFKGENNIPYPLVVIVRILREIKNNNYRKLLKQKGISSFCILAEGELPELTEKDFFVYRTESTSSLIGRKIKITYHNGITEETTLTKKSKETEGNIKYIPFPLECRIYE